MQLSGKRTPTSYRAGCCLQMGNTAVEKKTKRSGKLGCSRRSIVVEDTVWRRAVWSRQIATRWRRMRGAPYCKRGRGGRRGRIGVGVGGGGDVRNGQARA